jgi:hypothetical protein
MKGSWASGRLFLIAMTGLGGKQFQSFYVWSAITNSARVIVCEVKMSDKGLDLEAIEATLAKLPRVPRFPAYFNDMRLLVEEVRRLRARVDELEKGMLANMANESQLMGLHEDFDSGEER